MFLARLTSLTVCIALLSTAVWSQVRGGGGRGSVTPRNTAPSANSGGYNIPGGAPLQTADQEGKLEFRTQSILVQVPAVVTDKAGNHIHNLTKDDFRVLENGKEQKISTFEEVVTTHAKLPVLTPKPGEFANLTLSEQEPRAVTVIALDTVNTPFLDQTYGRRELVKYLAKSLDTGQVLALMIITSHGLKIVQGLTGDTAQLQQILNKVSGEVTTMETVDVDARADAAVGDIPDVPTVAPGGDPTAAIDTFVERGDAIYAQFQQQNAIETTMNAFLGIAWSLSGVPGRKSLIWATGGFPFMLSSPAVVPGGYLSAVYERAMQALTQANISVYPVDVRGLVNTSPISDVSKSGVRTGSALINQMNNRAWMHQSSLDTLNEFADMTGGKAFYNTNDLAESFRRAADDASSYYMIGYYLDTHNEHAGWRQVKVKVDKKDIEVRARKGFLVTNATIHMDMTRKADLAYALTSPIEGTGVPVSVQWSGLTPDGDKKKAVFQAHMPANSLTFDASAQNSLNFDFVAMAFNAKDGKQAGQVAFNFDKPVPEEKMATFRTNGVVFKNSLDLAAGNYVVRFVVRDNVSGKVGSVTAPLTVN